MQSSSNAVASPPSVTSCMALVAADSAAIRASVMMLMLARNRRPVSISESFIPRLFRRSPNSLAIIAVPSTATPLVNSTRSPGAILRLSIRWLRVTVPAIIPVTTGRVTASVISVCPPHRVMSHFLQKNFSSSMTWLISEGVTPGGNSRVVSSHRGLAPDVAISLALIKTAYWPMESVAKVMGSDLSTNTSSGPTSTAAVSSPTPGLMIIEGSSKIN